MISKETAYSVWNCYHEIEKSYKLIADMKVQLEKTGDANLIDAFGRKQQLQLGVPMGNDSLRIFDVRPALALKVIEQHIIEKTNELNKLEPIIIIEMQEGPALQPKF